MGTHIDCEGIACPGTRIERWPLTPGDDKLCTTGNQSFDQRYRCPRCGAVCWVGLSITSMDWSL